MQQNVETPEEKRNTDSCNGGIMEGWSGNVRVGMSQNEPE
jgi:hypothetical protein